MNDTKLTPRLEEMLSVAAMSAKRSNKSYVGSEDVLLAMANGNGTAAKILTRLGISSEQIEKATEQELKSGAPESTEKITVHLSRRFALETVNQSFTLPVAADSPVSQKVKDAASAVVAAVHALEEAATSIL